MAKGRSDLTASAGKRPSSIHPEPRKLSTKTDVTHEDDHPPA
jgi:hypothetical protein